MKWLGARVVCLCVILAMLSGVAVAIGRSQPEIRNLREELGLTTCGGTLCFLGFIPNVAPWSDVVDAVMRYPEPYIQESCVSVKFSRYAGRIAVCTSATEVKKLGFVVIAPTEGESSLPIGSLVAKYGLPCAIVSEYANGGFGLIYRYFWIDVSANERLQPSDVVTGINIGDRGELGVPNPCVDIRPNVMPWRGFTQYREP